MAMIWLVTFLFGFLIIKFIGNNFISSKRSTTASPPSLPIIGHLYLFKKPLHRTLLRISARFGPVVPLRFGHRPAILVSSLSLAQDCFTKLDATFAGRPHFPSAERITYGYKTIGTAEYGPHWRKLRRITSLELFSSLHVQSTEALRQNEMHALLRGLRRNLSGAGDKFQPVELKTRLNGVVLNLMMTNMVGKRYYGEEGVDNKAKWFMEIVERSLSVIGVSNLVDFFPVLKHFGFNGIGKTMTVLEKDWDEYLQGLIDEHRQNKQDDDQNEKDGRKKTMIETLLALQRNDPEYYNDQIIKPLLLGLFLAGMDTSAATLEWGMSLLLNHPTAMENVREEIEAKVGHRFVREDDLPNLPYLTGVINETLRLYPPAPLLLPHESINNCMLGGVHVARGTMLLVNVYAIQRDPKMWEDPAVFRPERFCNVLKDDERRMLLPFGMGRRRCPAEGLSMRLVGLVLGALLQCFEWNRVGNEEIDMSEGAGLTMRKLKPLEAMYRPRAAMADVLFKL